MSSETGRTFSVYKGERGGKIVYIGTTIQQPAARFRWHKANGKNLAFTVLGTFKTSDEMLAEELRLIQLHKPAMNKITDRKQNLNAALSADQLDARRGSAEWCQCCLKRRVNAGYKRCMYCGKGKP